MRQFAGYEAKKATTNNPLPAGGYVANIIGAKEETYSWGSVLVIAFDIAEGDHKGHFKREFDSNENANKKWKGTFRLTVPEESSQYFATNNRIFGNTMWAIENSNKGYSWDWDENKLKGKSVGVLFRNEEWEYEDKTGWTTKCCSFASVDDIRNGNFKMPKDKSLKRANATTPSQPTALPNISDLSDFEEILSNDGVPF